MGGEPVGAMEQGAGSEVVTSPEILGRATTEPHAPAIASGAKQSRILPRRCLDGFTARVPRNDEIEADILSYSQQSPERTEDQIARANMRKPGAPMIVSKAGSRFSSAKTKPALV